MQFDATPICIVLINKIINIPCSKWFLNVITHICIVKVSNISYHVLNNEAWKLSNHFRDWAKCKRTV